MEFIPTKQLSQTQKESLFNLWNRESPRDLTYARFADFEMYLSKWKVLIHFLLMEEEEVKGWMMLFTREEATWFVILLASDTQGKGYGTQLLEEAKQVEPELNGWLIDHDRDQKLDGSSYRSPTLFYLKNDFEILSDIRLETAVLSTVKIRWRRST